MERNDKSRFLLYVHPKKGKNQPINDEWTKLMLKAFNEAEDGVANYSSVGEKETFRKGAGFKGWHDCTGCGERSSNKDYLLKNGMITNSLCVHYLCYHRNDIEQNDWDKLEELKKFYKK